MESPRIAFKVSVYFSNSASPSSLVYILDEPSIGLHQRDNDKLLATLEHLRDLGNTLIVVEHDEDTMRAADYLVDVGPGAGSHGGEIVASGTLADIVACPRSVTGQYLSGVKKIPVPATRRPGNGKKLIVRGARENNLKDLDVEIPLGTFTCVTGVSGSGKSSLVNEVLNKTLLAKLNHARTRPGACRCIEGLEHLDKVIDIDQSPIGRTPRSNPATYTGLFNDIRDLFASTADAKMRGYGPGTLPSTVTLPAVGRSKRFIQRTSVDFPAPENPMIPNISPFSTESVTSRTACTCLPPLPKSLETCVSSIKSIPPLAKTKSGEPESSPLEMHYHTPAFSRRSETHSHPVIPERQQMGARNRGHRHRHVHIHAVKHSCSVITHCRFSLPK